MSARPAPALPSPDAYARAAFDGCANALSALLNHQITIDLVEPLQRPDESITTALAPPWLAAEARFLRGLTGVQALLIPREDALAIARLALGEDGGTVDPSAPEVDETLREIVAHIVSSAGGALTSLLGQPVGLAPAEVSALADGEWTPDAAAIAIGALAVDGAPTGKLALAIPSSAVDASAVAVNTASGPARPAGSPPSLDMILDISMPVTVELGRTRMLIRDILALGPGSVIELEKLAGEPVDLLVNERPIARGEVVVIDENFGVRLTEISQPAERLRSLS